MSEHRVFDTFPNLKIIVSHGGGSIPYQIGRWRSLFKRQWGMDFDECLSKFYFDTVLYNPESIELLVKMVGSERCMFGTENPGTGSTMNDKTERSFDDTKPWIDELTGITDADRQNIYENVAKKVFTRFKV
jgi:4-oxalmesaconate hydratase